MGHVSIVIGHGTKVIGNGICDMGHRPCVHSHGTRVTDLGYWVNGLMFIGPVPWVISHEPFGPSHCSGSISGSIFLQTWSNKFTELINNLGGLAPKLWIINYLLLVHTAQPFELYSP